MNERAIKTQSTICKYNKINVDIQDDPIKLPSIDQFKEKYKFTTLLKKIKVMNNALSQNRYSNKISLTPVKTQENSFRENCPNYINWKDLALDHNDYKQMYKTLELQNLRIKRIKNRH